MTMEFELIHEIKREKVKDGKEITYSYKFNGQEESNKTILTMRTEKKLNLSIGAIINIDFTNTQTKVQ